MEGPVPRPHVQGTLLLNARARTRLASLCRLGLGSLEPITKITPCVSRAPDTGVRVSGSPLGSLEPMRSPGVPRAPVCPVPPTLVNQLGCGFSVTPT